MHFEGIRGLKTELNYPFNDPPPTQGLSSQMWYQMKGGTNFFFNNVLITCYCPMAD